MRAKGLSRAEYRQLPGCEGIEIDTTKGAEEAEDLKFL
jgi:hypothetical protein